MFEYSHKQELCRLAFVFVEALKYAAGTVGLGYGSAIHYEDPEYRVLERRRV